MILAASLVSPLSPPTSIYAEKEGELSLSPIFFQQVLLRSAAHLFKWGREGGTFSLPVFSTRKNARPALCSLSARQPFRRGGEEEGPWMEEKGGFPVPFRYNVGGGVICIPGRLGHSLPSSPFPAAPPSRVLGIRLQRE